MIIIGNTKNEVKVRKVGKIALKHKNTSRETNSFRLRFFFKERDNLGFKFVNLS